QFRAAPATSRDGIHGSTPSPGSRVHSRYPESAARSCATAQPTLSFDSAIRSAPRRPREYGTDAEVHTSLPEGPRGDLESGVREGVGDLPDEEVPGGETLRSERL